MFAPAHYRDFVADMAGLRARLRCAVEDGTAVEAELRDALAEMDKRFERFDERQARHFAQHGLRSASHVDMDPEEVWR